MRAQTLHFALALALLGCKAEPESRQADASAAPGPAAEAEAEAELGPEARSARPRVEVLAGPEDEGGPRFRVDVPHPSHAPGAGPRVGIDVAHENYAMPQNFAVFADALRADGFVVTTLGNKLANKLDAAALDELELLVIVNPLHERNVGEWTLPTPSAFSPEEIAALEAWVRGGGALWLVADHMPFPGASAQLAARFGFTLNNGFAFRGPEPGRVERTMIQFRRDAGTIVAGHPITAGLEQVQSFTGEAFEAPPEATPLLIMPDDGISLMPAVAWAFDSDTPRQDVGAWPVAAVREFGDGRVAMFGEAAMLSARFVRTEQEWVPVGLHAPDSHDNLALVLATARWLVAGADVAG